MPRLRKLKHSPFGIKAWPLEVELADQVFGHPRSVLMMPFRPGSSTQVVRGCCIKSRMASGPGTLSHDCAARQRPLVRHDRAVAQ